MVRWLPLVLPLSVLIGCGLWGIDFGYHWDEARLGLAVDGALREGRLLPDFYNYPSVAYWLTFAALLPDLALALVDGHDVPLREQLHAAMANVAHQMQVRALFLCMSSLAVVWVYAGVLRWRRSWPEALVAAGLLAGSWQVGYHLRWIAPDGLMMMFGAASLACSLLAVQQTGGRRWSVLAAAAAGVGCGSKYPGGLLLLLPLSAEWVRQRSPEQRTNFVRASLPLVGLFAVAYLITTPGTLLDARTFIQDVTWEIEHYRIGHGAYTVAPGPVHLGRALFYLLLVMPSPIKPLAAVLSLAGAVGVAACIRARDGRAPVLLLFPAVYVLYMCSQRVMIVRNLLVLAPFGAILAARGLAAIHGVQPRGLRIAGTAALAGLLLYHAAFAAWAAGTIRDRGSTRFVEQAVEYARSHPARRLYVTSRVKAEIEAAQGQQLGNVTSDPSATVDVVLLYHSETMPLGEYPANLPDFTTRWFGPYEIDPVYYSTWFGDDRLMLVSAKRARALRVPRALYD